MKHLLTLLALLCIMLSQSSQSHYGCGGDMDCEVIKPLMQYFYLPPEAQNAIETEE